MSKKNSKVLSKSAIAAALSISAVVPVAAIPAAAAELPITEVIYNIDGKLVAIDVATFESAANADVLKDLIPDYVKTTEGKYYTFDAFTEAVNALEDGATIDGAIELLNSVPEEAQNLENVVVGDVSETGEVVPPATTELKVESVSAINATTVEVTLKDAIADLTKEKFKLVVDGTEVTVGAVAANADNTKYTLAIASLDGKAGKLSVNGTEATYDFSYPQVESAAAINASELIVTFNKDVDVTTGQTISNYQLKVNNVDVAATDILNITVSGNKATILLDSDVTFQSGDKYVIQTNNAIKSQDGKFFEKFVSEEKTFNESVAPVLDSIKVDANGLVLKFDRPVNSHTATDVSLIKVDGVAITSKDLKPVTSKTNPPNDATDADVLGKAGKYEYTVGLTSDELKAATTVGKHEVIIYDLKDTAKAYEAVASVLTGEYTITGEVAAPEVTGIEALNANKFFLYTNVSVTLSANTKLKVEKGTHEFALIDSSFDDTLSTSDTKVDAVTGVHPVNGKPGIFVVVTDDVNGDDENPLYKNSETTANLKVTIENFTANGIVGKKSEQTVTLNRNNTKPAIKETAIVGNDLKVTFTNSLAQLGGSALTGLNADDVVIRDKDSIVKAPSSAITVSGAVVTIPLTSATDGPYTVEFKADKFKNLEVSTAVKTYLVNTIKNDKLVATVAAKDNNFKYTQFSFKGTMESQVGDVNAAGKWFVADNQITFQYGVNMSDSARNASNYTLDGKALPAGSTVDFVGDKKTVRITLPKGTLKASTQYKLGIKTDVKTETGSQIVGSLQTKAPAEVVITLNDNIAPELKSAQYLVADEEVKPTTETDLIEVTFNEKLVENAGSGITDNATSQNDFSIVINGSTIGVAAVTDGTVGDDKLVLKLKQKVNVNQAATISITPEDQQVGTLAEKEIAIKDLAGNKANTTVAISVTVSKYDQALGKAAAIAEAKTELAKLTYNAANSITDADKLTAAKAQYNAAKTAVEAAVAKGATANTTDLGADYTKYTDQKTEIDRYEAAVAKAAAIAEAKIELAKLTYSAANSITDADKLADAKAQYNAAKTAVEAAVAKGATANTTDLGADYTKYTDQKTEIDRYELAAAIAEAKTELAKLTYSAANSITDADKLADAEAQYNAAKTAVEAAVDKGATANTTDLGADYTKYTDQKTEIDRYKSL